MSEDEGWNRVADLIRQVTADQFTVAEKASRLGVSAPTVRKLLAGEPVTHRVAVRSLTQTMGWPADALDRVRAGLPPTTGEVPLMDGAGLTIEDIDRRLAVIEERLGITATGATVTRLPAHEDPAELAAAAEGDQDARGAGATPGRGAKPKPRRS